MTDERISTQTEIDDLSDEALDRAAAERRLCYGCVRAETRICYGCAR